MRLCLRDPAFSHFGTIPVCYGQTDGRTYGHRATAYTAPAKRRVGNVHLRTACTRMCSISYHYSVIVSVTRCLITHDISISPFSISVSFVLRIFVCVIKKI